MSGEQFLHLGNHKFLEGSAVSLIVMEGVLGLGMVGVMGNLGCLVWWVWWVLWI